LGAGRDSLKMSRFKLLFTLLFIFGCDSREAGEYSKVHWDRDMCERVVNNGSFKVD